MRCGVYDCLYIALAEREGCEFLTADDKLVKNLGAQLPYVSAAVLPVSYGDTLIFATDGIRSGFADKLNINASIEEIAHHIIENHWRKIDDGLVLVARYVHKSEPGSQ